MHKRKFTKEEISDLLKNKNVVKCSEKAISYSKDFKIAAVRRYQNEGTSAMKIFKEAGFNIDNIGKETAKGRLRSWLKTAKTQGIDALSAETRGKSGGRPRTKGITDAYRIKRMEAEIAYLKAENDFLAKLRAKRAE